MNSRWIEIYKEVCKLEEMEEQETICADSLYALNSFKNETFDFILTDVPYWNMDALEKTRNKTVRQSKLNNFENNTEEQSKKEWLNLMKKILSKSIKKLKHGNIWLFLLVICIEIVNIIACLVNLL